MIKDFFIKRDQCKRMLILAVVLALSMGVLCADASEESLNGLCSITIDLEKDNKIFTVEAYKVADNENEYFTYTDSFKNDNLKPYDAISRISEKKYLATELANLIDKYSLEPTVTADATEGKAVLSELEPGLYLVRQRKDTASNVEIEEMILTAVPFLDGKTGDFENDAIETPGYTDVVWFTFRPEVVSMIMIAVAIVLAVLLCFDGYHFLPIAIYIAIGMITGVLGMKLGRKVTPEFVYHMAFFVIFAVSGTGFTVFFMGILIHIFRRVAGLKDMRSVLIIITVITGSATLFFTINRYLNINTAISAIIAAIGLITGIPVQFSKKKKDRPFYTYEDLMRIQPVQEAVNDA